MQGRHWAPVFEHAEPNVNVKLNWFMTLVNNLILQLSWSYEIIKPEMFGVFF